MPNLYGRGRPRKATTDNPGPSKEGEYRMRNRKTGEIDYIGETYNLKR